MSAPEEPALPPGEIAFGRRLPRRSIDRLLRQFEVRWANVRRRNPVVPPWWRREMRRWQTQGSGPGPSEPSRRVVPLLFGVAAVWNEDDIIYATVRNLFEQGAQRVFVIDDESDDRTASEARAAGATVVTRSSDGRYSEVVRTRAVQELIAAETGAAGGDVWWLIVDGDEFPRGPHGATILDTVSALPGWVDVVGSRVLDHVPSSTSRYSQRQHPAEAFPLARWCRDPYCAVGHWKHQLMRVRESGDLVALRGHHVVRTGDGLPAREAEVSLLMHHFPLRDYERTAAKLARAVAPGSRYELSPNQFSLSRVRRRVVELEHCYADESHLQPSRYPGQRKRQSPPRRWPDLVDPSERDWPRSPIVASQE
jgi:hypothetical protein